MGAIFTPPEVLKTFPTLPLETVTIQRALAEPDAIDHSAYLPPVGDQGDKGTCVAWATGYYYRTYQEAVEHGWSLALPDGSPNPDHIFSPAWVFGIGGTHDDGASGMMTADAFTIFQERGATTLSVMPNVYSPFYLPTPLQEEAALPYRAEAFSLNNPSTGLPYSKTTLRRWLNGYYAPNGWTPPDGDIFNIAFNVPGGFSTPAGTCPKMWVDPDEIKTEASEGGHAITVIGYSNTITFTGGVSPTAVYTGGFEIINSWGKDWGCDGKVWFPYAAWDTSLTDGRFIQEAWGMIDYAERPITGRVTSGGPGLGGVEVRLNNNPYLATATNASGYYTLTAGYEDTLTVKSLMVGYTFAPAVATVPMTTAAASGVDFVATVASPDLSTSTKTVDHPVNPNTTPVEFTVNVASTGGGSSFVLTDIVPISTTYVVNSAQASWGTVHAEGDLSPWMSLAGSLNTPRYGLSAQVGHSSGGTYYVYAIGGQDTTTDQTLDTVERAAINPDGSLGAWTVMSNRLNIARAFFDTAMLNIGGADYIYAIGGGQGYTATAVPAPGVHMDLSTVERAPVNADGTVGPWQVLASTLAVNRSELSVVTDGNYMYAIGGINWDTSLYPRTAGKNPLRSVEYAPIYTNGNLGPWRVLTSMLMDSRSTADAVIVSGGATSYIYVIGGRTTGNESRSYSERAPINADGTVGPWSLDGRMHLTRYGAPVVTLGDYIYAVGGRDHGGSLGQVDRAMVYEDGTMSDWQLSPGALVAPRDAFAAVVYNNQIYALGGRQTQVYCVDYYDRGTGCGTSIGSVETTKPVAPGSVWWSSEVGAADALSITLSVQPQAPGTGSLLLPGTVFTNAATIDDGAGVSTVVRRSVRVTDVDMAGARKEVYPAQVSFNGIATFTITVPNAGGWTAASVMDPLPQGFKYVVGSGQASSGVMGTPGEVWSWDETNGPTYSRQYFSLVAPGNDSVYAIGPWAETEYTSINPDGSLGAWQFATDMSMDRQGVAAVAPGNGYIYAVGGGSTAAVNSVERARILSDGSLGDWQVLTSTLVYPRSWHSVVAPGNGYLYAFSGYEGNQTTSYTSTEYCKINADGTLGPWRELAATVKETRDMLGAVAYNGYVYLAGGEDWNEGSRATVEYAKINADGTLGDFTVSPNEMNYARDTFGFTRIGNMLYAVGGRRWGPYSGPDLDNVEYAEIKADGSIGPWFVNHGRLPVGLGFPQAATQGNNIYVVDTWSAYYTQLSNSVRWEGEVDYQGQATLTFQAKLVGNPGSTTVTNTATIEHSMGSLDRSVSLTSLAKFIYLPIITK